MPDRTSELIGQLKCTESWLIRVDSKLDEVDCKLSTVIKIMKDNSSGMTKDDVAKLVKDLGGNVKTAESLSHDPPK